MSQENMFADSPNSTSESEGSAQNWPANSDWNDALASHFGSPTWQPLMDFLSDERGLDSPAIFPNVDNVFRAFQLTPLSKIRFVILGQDPYHGPGQADGLCFSVPEGTKLPPSLRNIYKELAGDLECEIPRSGDLSHWARQGGMMLNTVLTVRAGQANSHRKKGWEAFTDEVIRIINQQESDLVFVLWGKPAQTKKSLIDPHQHLIIESPHPSPLSAHRGFFGSKPFSKINQHLERIGQSAIDWVA